LELQPQYVNLFLESGRLGKSPRSSCLHVRIGSLHVWNVIDGKSRYCAILQGVTTFAFDKEYVAKLMRREHNYHGVEDLSLVNEFLEVCDPGSHECTCAMQTHLCIKFQYNLT
jgi:hypothetical protein